METNAGENLYFVMLDWSARRHMSWAFLNTASSEDILIFGRLALATKAGKEYLEVWEQNYTMYLN